MALDIVLWSGAGILVIAGLAGLVMPVLPGAPVLFLGLVLAAWTDDFASVGPGALAVLGVMALGSYAADFLAGALGARRFGATNRAAIGAVLGALVGLFFGIVGILVGPFVGAVLGELTARRDLRAAGRAGFGATLGLALGIAAKLALGLSMVSLFAFLRFL